MITTFSENALIPEQESTKEELTLIKRRLMAICEELDHTLFSLSEDNFTIELKNRLASMEKSCEAAKREESEKSSYAYQTPVGTQYSAWDFVAGGFIKIGNIVIVRAQVKPHNNSGASLGANGYSNIQGGFPKPTYGNGADSTFAAIAAVTSQTGVVLNASITGSGTLRLRGPVNQNITNVVDFSGIYLTNK